VDLERTLEKVKGEYKSVMEKDVPVYKQTDRGQRPCAFEDDGRLRRLRLHTTRTVWRIGSPVHGWLVLEIGPAQAQIVVKIRPPKRRFAIRRTSFRFVLCRKVSFLLQVLTAQKKADLCLFPANVRGLGRRLNVRSGRHTCVKISVTRSGC